MYLLLYLTEFHFNLIQLFQNNYIKKIVVIKNYIFQATITSFDIVFMIRFSPESGIGVHT
jgi:hypothetical protein